MSWANCSNSASFWSWECCKLFAPFSFRSYYPFLAVRSLQRYSEDPPQKKATTDYFVQPALRTLKKNIIWGGRRQSWNILQIKDLKILENAGKSRIFQSFEQHISATRKDFSDFPKDSERSWAETSISDTFTARKNPCTFSPRFQITVIRFFSKNTDFLFVDLKIRGFIFLALEAPFLNVSGAQLFWTPKIIT